MSGKNSPATIDRDSFDAVIFDLDGVITKTAKVHAAAWKELFDEYLKKRAEKGGENFQPFDITKDYQEYVDGKPRYDGVQSFLESRGIDLPYGDPEDDPGKETVCGLGNKKNEFFHKHLEEDGVEVYEHAPRLLQQLREGGFKTAIVSSSKNCSAVLKAVGLTDSFDAQVDGVVSEELGLKGKPAPAIFLEAAKRLGVEPQRAVLLEDAVAGVQAAQAGNFRLVVGVDRTGHGKELQEKGADVTVTNLGQIRVGKGGGGGQDAAVPSALDRRQEILQRAAGKALAVFLDYDGTLTPIVSRPENAKLKPQMRQTIKELAAVSFVAIISGRDLPDVQDLVGLDNLFYAGSHGFDIAGPQGQHLEHQAGQEFLPDLDEAEKSLRDHLEDKIPGVQVERKKFSLAVHYRRVDDSRVGEVEEVVDQVQQGNGRLKKTSGKKIFELQPDMDWNKGKALLWLLDKLDLDRPQVLPFYLGDDVTDEDAFAVLKERGIGIAVQEEPKDTAAGYRLRDPEEVEKFLQGLIDYVQEGQDE